MKTQNIIIVDEKQIMAGSMARYLKYRFGPSIKISCAANIESCEKELNNKSQVIVLEYKLDDTYDANRGAHIKNTLKGYYPDVDVILLSSDEDVKDDIVKRIKKLEREASRHIIKNSKKPLTVGATVLKNAIVYPIKLLADEHSIGQFVGFFLI